MAFDIGTRLTLEEIKTPTATKRCPLGTRGVTPDGRVFYYALNGATALVISDLVQTPPPGAFATAGEVPGMDTQDVTSTWTKIRLSGTGSTWLEPCVVNEYADGYLIIEASTGAGQAGQIVKVKSNTVCGASNTSGVYYSDFTFDPEDPRLKPISTGDTIQVIRNEYYKVVAYSAVTTMVGTILGMPICAVAANYYFWLQTWGACVARNQDVTILGNALVLNELTTGATGTVSPMDGTTGTTSSIASLILGGIVGYQLGNSPGSGDYGLIFLTIRP